MLRQRPMQGHIQRAACRLIIFDLPQPFKGPFHRLANDADRQLVADNRGDAIDRLAINRWPRRCFGHADAAVAEGYGYQHMAHFIQAAMFAPT